MPSALTMLYDFQSLQRKQYLDLKFESCLNSLITFWKIKSNNIGSSRTKQMTGLLSQIKMFDLHQDRIMLFMILRMSFLGNFFFDLVLSTNWDQMRKLSPKFICSLWTVLMFLFWYLASWFLRHYNLLIWSKFKGWNIWVVAAAKILPLQLWTTTNAIDHDSKIYITIMYSTR